MAVTSAVTDEFQWGNKRARLYTMLLDGSSTSFTLKPGVGYGNPVGAYTTYSESAGTFAFVNSAGGSGSYTSLMFFSPREGI